MTYIFNPKQTYPNHPTIQSMLKLNLSKDGHDNFLLSILKFFL